MNIFFCRDQIPTQGTKGGTEGRSFAQICAKNEQCTATIGRAGVRGDSPEKWTAGGERWSGGRGYFFFTP